MLESFGFDNASYVANIICDEVDLKGYDSGKIRHGLILGSGLGGFAEDHLSENAVRFSFSDLYKKLGLKINDIDSVAGHTNELIIAPLKDDESGNLIIAQAGREHLYQGVDPRRAVFWIRVMQVLAVDTLFGSNAAGILTPDTLEVPSLMLINSDQDLCDDSPLKGINDERFGPQFPHMGDLYTAKMRMLAKNVAKDEGVNLPEGMYIRMKGPNYERSEDVYNLRNMVDGIWKEGQKQVGEDRFFGLPVAVAGMSTSYEMLVAAQGAQSVFFPAFKNGKVYFSACTNYSGALGKNGFEVPSNHKEVQENALKVQNDLSKVVKGMMMELNNEL